MRHLCSTCSAGTPVATPCFEIRGVCSQRSAPRSARKQNKHITARRAQEGHCLSDSRLHYECLCSALTAGRALTLWKGPICCTPAYDLKFSRVMCVMMRRVRGAATFSAPSAADIVSVRLGPRMPSHCPLQSRMNGIFKPANDFQILE